MNDCPVVKRLSFEINLFTVVNTVFVSFKLKIVFYTVKVIKRNFRRSHNEIFSHTVVAEFSGDTAEVYFVFISQRFKNTVKVGLNTGNDIGKYNAEFAEKLAVNAVS